MHKILVSLQGKTLILTFTVKSGLVRNGVGWEPYIQVLPSWELSRFDLRGLTPDMFCTNIADMVNVRNCLSGVVENEQQLPVAKWIINEDDYRRALAVCTLNHAQMVDLLKSLPGYAGEFDGEFIEFEATLVAPDGSSAAYGYRLTVATQNIGSRIAPHASYSLDTLVDGVWQGYPPPQDDHEALRATLTACLQAIADAGVAVTQAYDATDYSYR